MMHSPLLEHRINSTQADSVTAQLECEVVPHVGRSESLITNRQKKRWGGGVSFYKRIHKHVIEAPASPWFEYDQNEALKGLITKQEACSFESILLA